MVTSNGITADLESMARFGIGGANIGHIAMNQAPGDIRTLSEKWWGMMEHAVKEGERIGVEIGAFNCPGWSASGGPWITPEHAMQALVWSEHVIVGGRRITQKLSIPRTELPPYRDVAVLAFRTPLGHGEGLRQKVPMIIPSGGASAEIGALTDGKFETPLHVSPDQNTDEKWVELCFSKPYKARSMRIALGLRQWATGELQALGADGVYNKVAGFTVNANRSVAARKAGEPAPMVIRFKPTTASRWRIRFHRGSDPLQISDLELTPAAMVDQYTIKSMRYLDRSPFSMIDFPEVAPVDDPRLAVGAEAVVDLSAQLRSDGVLEWDAPEGEWLVLRFGMSPLDRLNHPVTPEGRGLECDKLNPAAVEANYRGMIGEWVRRVGPLAGKALTFTTIDSFEAGSQNWSPVFRGEFIRRRGYDPVPWLPVMAGYIVGDADRSDRFLWDLRRTLADAAADVSVGHLRELANRDGLKLWIECDGPTQFFESLQYGGRADEVAGEFWNDYKPPSTQTKVAASVAHIYGKQIVGTESFTAGPRVAGWKKYPFSLKALSDATFCGGANRLTLHVYAHQPWPELSPGQSLGGIGTHFGSNAWWDRGSSWGDYLRRCQYLLQQGESVIDVAYFIGEGVPRVAGELKPAVEGYHYDWINREAILRLDVRDGRLVLPHGMSYRALVLSRETTITAEVIEKIAELVDAGATVIGNMKPKQSPSLVDYPEADRRVRACADRLWGAQVAAGTLLTGSAGSHRCGKGTMVWGVDDLDACLKKLGIEPDLTGAETPGIGRWMFYHKQLPGKEFYFVSNQSDEPLSQTLSFRALGRPSLWDPLDGKVLQGIPYRVREGRTELDLRLDQKGAIFVVFESVENDSVHISRIVHNGSPLYVSNESGSDNPLLEANGRYEIEYTDGAKRTITLGCVRVPFEIKGPWQVTFPALPVYGHPLGTPTAVVLEHLVDWSEHESPDIKYYSGTASYRAEFDLPEVFRQPAGTIAEGADRWFLDLGNVQVLARVLVNGQDCGGLWASPFRVDVSGLLRSGKNSLEVEVSNLMVNRMIGDDVIYPEDTGHESNAPSTLKAWPQWLLQCEPRPTERKTFAVYKQYDASSPLLPSGLIGPVRLIHKVGLESASKVESKALSSAAPDND